MDTIKSVYKKAGIIISKRPWKFWGIVLLADFIIALGYILSGGVPGVGIVLEVLIEAALAMIFVRGLFNETPDVEDIFAAFKSWDTALHVMGGMLWRDLWIFLWALIPVAGPVFAVIRAYEYRFVPYILMNEPEVGARDAIKVSKARTNGKKAKMFWADTIAIVGIALVVLILFALANVKFLSWIFILLFIVALAIAVLVLPFFLGLVSAIFFVDGERAREGSKFYVEPEAREEPKPTEPQNDYYSADKFCPHCGAPMKSGDVFCSACGGRFDAPPAAAPEEEETIAADPVESLAGVVPVAEALNPEDIE